MNVKSGEGTHCRRKVRQKEGRERGEGRRGEEKGGTERVVKVMAGKGSIQGSARRVSVVNRDR